MRIDPNIKGKVNFTDDTAVYELSNSLTLVHSMGVVKFVNFDPFIFGRVTALNALNSIFAKGGKPLNALSFLSTPTEVEDDISRGMLEGGRSEFSKHGSPLMGGQLLTGDELLLGYSINGLLSDGVNFRNKLTVAGELLILTKKIGTGLLCAGQNKGILSDVDRDLVISAMLLSNYAASSILKKFEVSAVAKIDSLGLAGQLYGMIKGTPLGIVIDSFSLPVFEMAVSLYGGESNGDVGDNRFKFGSYINNETDSLKSQLIFNSELSGGLLLSVQERDVEKLLISLRNLGYSDSAVIGYVTDKFDNSQISIV